MFQGTGHPALSPLRSPQAMHRDPAKVEPAVVELQQGLRDYLLLAGHRHQRYHRAERRQPPGQEQPAG